MSSWHSRHLLLVHRSRTLACCLCLFILVHNQNSISRFINFTRNIILMHLHTLWLNATNIHRIWRWPQSNLIYCMWKRCGDWLPLPLCYFMHILSLYLFHSLSLVHLHCLKRNHFMDFFFGLSHHWKVELHAIFLPFLFKLGLLFSSLLHSPSDQLTAKNKYILRDMCRELIIVRPSISLDLDRMNGDYLKRWEKKLRIIFISIHIDLLASLNSSRFEFSRIIGFHRFNDTRQ